MSTSFCLGVSIAAIFSASVAGVARAQGIPATGEAVAVAKVVGDFHDALSRGDSTAALALLALDAAILESGDVESRSEYRSHHLAADIEFAKNVPSKRNPAKVQVQGSVAWTVGTSVTEGTYDGGTINSVGSESMVLTKGPSGWRIRSIHWSSRKRRPPAAASAPSAKPSAIDWAAVDAEMGRVGVDQPGGVRRFSMPRSDLTVKLDDVTLRTALALGSWIAFMPMGDGAIAMGDFVLRDTEVASAMARLQEGGIEQTAVHHHLLRESPRLVYMHVHAHGDPVKLAATVRSALSMTGTPMSSPTATSPAEPTSLDTAGIAKALGYSGRMNGGVYQVSVPRAGAIRDSGMETPASMGLATAINFQPTSTGKAAITGDFVLVASEVNPVIRALRKNGIEVTSLHNHMLNDEPRLFFMHFWANDNAFKLALGLSEALSLTDVRR